MIAHQGGYKERNIFESSLHGGHLPVAFASRKKSKRGVLLQQTKPKSRRRISLNEVDLIEEEEEEEGVGGGGGGGGDSGRHGGSRHEGEQGAEGEDGDGFVDVEEEEQTDHQHHGMPPLAMMGMGAGAAGPNRVLELVVEQEDGNGGDSENDAVQS